MLKAFCIGTLCASIVFGYWWLTLAAGVGALLLGRSYFVLACGVTLDLLFATTGTPVYFIGMYTLTFSLVTLTAEYIRKDLFWTS